MCWPKKKHTHIQLCVLNETKPLGRRIAAHWPRRTHSFDAFLSGKQILANKNKRLLARHCRFGAFLEILCEQTGPTTITS